MNVGQFVTRWLQSPITEEQADEVYNQCRAFLLRTSGQALKHNLYHIAYRALATLEEDVDTWLVQKVSGTWSTRWQSALIVSVLKQKDLLAAPEIARKASIPIPAEQDLGRSCEFLFQRHILTRTERGFEISDGGPNLPVWLPTRGKCSIKYAGDA